MSRCSCIFLSPIVQLVSHCDEGDDVAEDVSRRAAFSPFLARAPFVGAVLKVSRLLPVLLNRREIGCIEEVSLRATLQLWEICCRSLSSWPLALPILLPSLVSSSSSSSLLLSSPYLSLHSSSDEATARCFSKSIRRLSARSNKSCASFSASAQAFSSCLIFFRRSFSFSFFVFT